MYPILLHIYGPFNLNSFSVALGIALFLFLILARNRAALLGITSKEDFTNGFIESALSGVFGGRLLHILSEWHHYDSFLDMLKIWNGGLSVLGSIIGIAAYASWYSKRNHIPLLPAFDCAALYAPLAHSIARIGCFLAGCCYGQPTKLPWGITYTNTEIAAPLHISLHPTQLYSSLSLLSIFLFMHYRGEKWCSKPGELSMLYLILTSIERWSIDFLRGDRVINSPFSFITTQWFSLDQWVALGILLVSCLLYIYSKLRPRQQAHAHESF